MTGRIALISTSDRTGLAEFARVLVECGFTILSTGGTGRALSDAGLPVQPVSAHTGFPEIMDGRVKTLHPRIHGGILGDRGRHAAEAGEHGISWIDVVVVNLYPFEQTVAGSADLDTAVENIDIGGPTLLRAAAKNHRHVAVVVDPADYARVGAAIAAGTLDQALRAELAVKAFRHTARYDAAISAWLCRHAGLDELADEGAIGLSRVQALRYGENPHQRAAFYADVGATGRSVARAVQRQGKQLSCNNLADLDAALRIVFEHEVPACAIVKHMNPAGLGTAPDLSVAFQRALAGDPESAFGGIVAFNRPLDGPHIAAIRSARTFFEVLAAPGFTQDALARIASRENLRVMEVPADWAASRPAGLDARRVQGGWLLQEWDLAGPAEWRTVTTRAPTPEEDRALRFAWRAVKGVKSNAIVLARALPDGEALNGVGAGQMSRVDSVRIAVRKATLPVPGSVLASDAFFPFPDGVREAAAAGVVAIVQPGGSVKDVEVVAAAEEAGVAMVFTGTRHFRH